jgi:hypothetical protein
MSGEIFDDPYDPNTGSLENETPTFDQVLLDAIHAELLNIHTALPCRIIRVKGAQKVDVQIELKHLAVLELPVVQDVPVQMPNGANYSFKFPIAVGDRGMLQFAERSLDKWLVSGGSVDPEDPRKFHLSDGVFYPGVNPFDAQVTGPSDDLQLEGNDFKLNFKKDRITFSKGDTGFTCVLGEPLTAILSAIVTAHNAHFHTGNLGAPTTPPVTPMVIADLTAKKHIAKTGEGL